MLPLAYWHREFTCSSVGQQKPQVHVGHTESCSGNQFHPPAAPCFPGTQPTTKKAYLAFQWDHSHSRRQGLTSNWVGAFSPTYHCNHSSWPHNRRAQAAHTAGNTRAYRSGDQSGVCSWAPKEVSYIRPLLQDCEMQLTHLTHRNKHRESGT